MNDCSTPYAKGQEEEDSRSMSELDFLIKDSIFIKSLAHQPSGEEDMNKIMKQSSKANNSHQYDQKVNYEQAYKQLYDTNE